MPEPKGKEGHREPADLAWFGNGCLMLMYMTQKRGIHDDPAVNSARRDRAIRHNLDQAKGALRLWRRGYPIEGHNSHAAFSIAHDAAEPIQTVVLSFAEVVNPIAQYHGDAARDLGVSMCATVPISAMDHLAHMGASVIDLLAFLIHLSERNGPWTEEEVSAELSVYARNMWRRSGAADLWPHGADDRFRIVDTFMHRLRFAAGDSPDAIWNIDAPPGKDVTETDRAALSQLFNDLLLFDYLRLVASIAQMIGIAVDGPKPRDLVRHIQLLEYDVILCVLPRMYPGLTRPFTIAREAAKHASRHGISFMAPTIYYIIDPGLPMCAYELRPFVSLTQQFLTSWLDDQGTSRHAAPLEVIREMYTPDV